MKLVGLENKVIPLCIPMKGRLIHDKLGNTVNPITVVTSINGTINQQKELNILNKIPRLNFFPTYLFISILRAQQ